MEQSISHFDLFGNTPYLERWENLGPDKCILIVVLITLLPLIILTAIEGHLLNDITVYIRFLIALPLLLRSPTVMQQKLHKIVSHFVDSKIIKESEREKFFSYVNSSHDLRDSGIAKLIIWILVYGFVFYFMAKLAPNISPSWRTISGTDGLSLSLAGRWFLFVSQPIYSFIQLYFLYRAVLWARLMFQISRLDLQLWASHGDDTGGLSFLSGVIKAFNLPVLALSISVAAGAMHLVLHEGLAITDLKITVAALIAFFMFLFVAPLFLFFKPLVRVKLKAIFSYGAFSGRQIEQFEKKWIRNKAQIEGPPLIESSEFSAVIDAIAIVKTANTMRTIPFDPKAVVGMVLCIVLPFLPVVALKVPWTEILKQLFKLVM